MLAGITDTVTLANGVHMPWLGLGTYKSLEGDAERAVLAALELGYRGIDTASFYKNEADIGSAVTASGVPRTDLFLATKVWNDEQGYDAALAACARSLQRLRTDYLDLYLVHWPQQETPATWRALERLYSEGVVRAIGVCNHLVHHLEELSAAAGILPMVNQFECHPWLQRADVLAYCHEHGIVAQAWSPLMKGRADEEPVLVDIAHAHDATASQVALRWLLQRGMSVIPKSVHPERIAENADVFAFELSAGEMDAIAAADRGQNLGPHPDRFPER